MNDKAIATILEQERQRQETELDLIASENYASEQVMHTCASVLTNKYAEGYPGKRYYGGCTIVDEAEQLAIDRCKRLFNAEHVNVQPHAGSQANMAVYHAFLKPGDTILGMSLAEGGHLTHGHPRNISGTLYNSIQYKVDPKTERLDYDAIEQLALEHKPKLMIIGASAYSRTLDFERFGAIAKKINAISMADIAHIAGLIAAGIHPNPFPHIDIVTSTTHKTLRGPRGGLIMCKQSFAADIDKAVMPGTQGGPFMHIIAAKAVAFFEALQPSFVEYQQQIVRNAQQLAQEIAACGWRIVTGGTDNHLFVIDVSSKGLNGKQAEDALAQAGITVSRSCIPFDTQKPWITSGIRLGTPAITTRGMKEAEITIIAHLINQALVHHTDDQMLAAIRGEIVALCNQFPIYNSPGNLPEKVTGEVKKRASSTRNSMGIY